MSLLLKYLRNGFIPTLVLLVLTQTGCSTISYVLHAGAGQFALYNHERPIEEVLADLRVDKDVRDRLQWIPQIKQFVEQELGVKATTNYTTYVDLKRPYVVWALTVAQPYELKVREWSFPLVGSFPYLGFFTEEKAKSWAADAKAEQKDVYVRGVTAYSTLGYFKDPLLSSMLSKNKADLVNLIFHETTHTHFYLKNEGAFNEQAASFIGDYGERLWLVKTFGENSTQLQNWESARIDRRALGEMLRDFGKKLTAEYEVMKTLSDDQKAQQKRHLYSDFQAKLANHPWRNVRMKRTSEIFVNNAAVLASLTYEDNQEVFDLVRKACKDSLKDALSLFLAFEKDWKAQKWQTASGSPEAVSFKNDISLQTQFKDWLLQARRGVCLSLHVNTPSLR